MGYKNSVGEGFARLFWRETKTMQCTSKTQAQRMAYFGARKMTEAGYLLRTTQWEGFYDVIKERRRSTASASETR